MLYADKRALETNLQVSLLKIREKELQFYTQNCIAIGTQAALLSGFAYNGIIQVDIPSDASDWLKTSYLCVTTMAMGFELIAVLNSTLCSMLGPGLALRGPDGSMHRAVDGLMLEYRLTFLFFTMGLIAFHLSALLFAWLEFSWPVALAMTVALLMFVYGMWRYFKRIYQRFALESDRYITGKFEFGDSAMSATALEETVTTGGLGEVLSGGIAALPATQPAAERQRTREAQRIIGLVEPGAPRGLGAEVLPHSESGNAGSGVGGQTSEGKCLMQ